MGYLRSGKNMKDSGSDFNIGDLFKGRKRPPALVGWSVAFAVAALFAYASGLGAAAGQATLSALPGGGEDPAAEPATNVTVIGDHNEVHVDEGAFDIPIPTDSPRSASEAPVESEPLPPAAETQTPPESSDDCSIVSPPPRSSVPGRFSVEGRCPAYAPGQIFMVIRNLHADATTGGAGPWWIQCPTEIHDSGDFACSGFMCVPDTEYEVAIVFPPAWIIRSF